MFLLDVNVVLAAHRGDHPHHSTVRPWVDAMLARGEAFAVPHVVASAFLRIATSRRIFPVPTPLEAAFGFLDELVAQPGYLAAEPGPRHRALLRDLCVQYDATGDLIPDAVIAAIAVEHAGTVATLDRDFSRFTSVRHVRPRR